MYAGSMGPISQKWVFHPGGVWLVRIFSRREGAQHMALSHDGQLSGFVRLQPAESGAISGAIFTALFRI